jgi:hypothetical protein
MAERSERDAAILETVARVRAWMNEPFRSHPPTLGELLDQIECEVTRHNRLRGERCKRCGARAVPWTKSGVVLSMDCTVCDWRESRGPR